MKSYIIAFLVLLNPFALFTYLIPIVEDLERKDFIKVLTRASLISSIIFIIFALFGTTIFRKVLSINFESFRIFGGIVITTYALIFIVQGRRSFFTLKGGLDNLASEIALPFMVGAATVSLCVVIGNVFTPSKALFIILITLGIHFLIILSLLLIKYNLLKKELRTAFDKTMNIFLRLNGFLVGAIGLDMIITGIKRVFANIYSSYL